MAKRTKVEPKVRMPRNQKLHEAEGMIAVSRLNEIREIVDGCDARECVILAAYSTRKANGSHQHIQLYSTVSHGMDGETVRGVVVKRMKAGMIKVATIGGEVITVAANECKVEQTPCICEAKPIGK